MTRYGMVIETDKCTACKACMVACTNRNQTPPGIHFNHIDIIEEGHYPDLRVSNISRLCMHCANAPCVEVCPTKATVRDENGIVAVDFDMCVGCGACIAACPYDARIMVDDIRPYEPDYGFTEREAQGYGRYKVGTVTKCTFCREWLEQGLEPACVHTCMYDARHFGDLDDPDSEVSRLIAQRGAVQLMPESGTDPSVYYVL